MRLGKSILSRVKSSGSTGMQEVVDAVEETQILAKQEMLMVLTAEELLSRDCRKPWRTKGFTSPQPVAVAFHSSLSTWEHAQKTQAHSERGALTLEAISSKAPTLKSEDELLQLSEPLGLGIASVSALATQLSQVAEMQMPLNEAQALPV